MTEEQKEKCQWIINRHTPVLPLPVFLTPGVIPLFDLGRILEQKRKRKREQAQKRERAAEMAMELAGVFGGSLTEKEAETLAAAALRKTADFEAAGWAVAHDLEQKFKP